MSRPANRSSCHVHALESRPPTLLERAARNVRCGVVVLGILTRKEVVVVKMSLSDRDVVVVARGVPPGDRLLVPGKSSTGSLVPRKRSADRSTQLPLATVNPLNDDEKAGDSLIGSAAKWTA